MRTHITRLTLVAALALSVSGCFTHKYSMGRGAATTGTPRYGKWHSHWLLGLISTDPEINLSEVCPSGNLTIVDQRNFLNLLVGYFIGIVWSPSVVEVYCDDTATSLNLTPEQLDRIGRSEAFAAWVEEVAPERVDEVLAARARMTSAPVCQAQ